MGEGPQRAQQQFQQRQGVPPAQAKSLNVKDTDDFPSLGGPRPK
jgi:hypothetical protein